MAGTWVPDSDARVGNGEPIGRRIFDDPLWRDDLGQGAKHILRQDHFYDNRIEEGLSFDRLGRNAPPEKRVLAFLNSLASREAEKYEKVFECWAYLKRSQILKADKKPYEIIADPAVDNPDGLADNPYHALLLRNEYDTAELAKLIALQLSVIFQNNGDLLFAEDVEKF